MAKILEDDLDFNFNDQEDTMWPVKWYSILNIYLLIILSKLTKF